MLQKLQRFNVAIGAGLALLILLTGFSLDLPEGWARGGPVLLAAVVFFLCAWAWKPKKPTTLNSFALLAIFGWPEWRLAILALVLFATLVAVALIVRSTIRFDRRLKGECGV